MLPGNRVGTPLSRLIKARAYLAGNRLTLEKRIETLKAELAAAKRELKAMLVEASRLETQIIELSGIDPADIRPIRALSRASDPKYGQFRGALIELLKGANGPITTDALLTQLAKRLQLSLATAADRKRAYSLVRRPLAKFAKRGAVIRLPSAKGERHGTWLWTGF